MVKNMMRLCAGNLFAMAAVCLPGAVHAADIVVLSSQALKPVVEELAPRFEAESGNHLVLTFDTSSSLKTSIDGGKPFDVAILTPPLIAALIQDEKVRAGSTVMLARSGLGLAVKKGAKHPDISSTEALKRTLATKSVAYITTGASGTMFLATIQKLGIADEVKAHAKTIQTGSTTDVVAKGEAELCVQLMPELTSVSAVEVVGPFPPEAQSYVMLNAGFSKAIKDIKPAEAFIAYLKKPASAALMRAKGLEPI